MLHNGVRLDILILNKKLNLITKEGMNEKVCFFLFVKSKQIICLLEGFFKIKKEINVNKYF